jgi:hypothetical protein
LMGGGRGRVIFGAPFNDVYYGREVVWLCSTIVR